MEACHTLDDFVQHFRAKFFSGKCGSLSAHVYVCVCEDREL